MAHQYYTLHPTVKVGDRVRCLRHRNFVDGSKHEKNDELLVTKETLAYYQRFVDGKQYEIMS